MNAVEFAGPEDPLDTSIFGRLIVCRCGHPLDRHDVGGCSGRTSRGCSCSSDETSVLAAAIDAASDRFYRYA